MCGVYLARAHWIRYQFFPPKLRVEPTLFDQPISSIFTIPTDWKEVIPCHRSSVAGISRQRSGFKFGPVYVGYLLNKVTMRHVPPVFCYWTFSINPQILRVYNSSIHLEHYMIVKQTFLSTQILRTLCIAILKFKFVHLLVTVRNNCAFVGHSTKLLCICWSWYEIIVDLLVMVRNNCVFVGHGTK